MNEDRWKTAVTYVERNKILIRGYSVDKLMGKISFAEAIYLIIKGEMPSPEAGKMMDAILVSSIDHGVTPPSTLSAITIASTGAEINSSIAGGILAISRYHGGAIENCMRVLLEVISDSEESGNAIDKSAEKIVEKYRSRKKRVAGFGHRLHTEDPRTLKLFELAKHLGFNGKYLKTIKIVESILELKLGRKLPINVDGAIAAILCELEFPPELANSLFIMARVPGLVAHVYEERSRYKPMRRIDPSAHEYDGPGEREP